MAKKLLTRIKHAGFTPQDPVRLGLVPLWVCVLTLFLRGRRHPCECTCTLPSCLVHAEGGGHLCWYSQHFLPQISRALLAIHFPLGVSTPYPRHALNHPPMLIFCRQSGTQRERFDPNTYAQYQVLLDSG